jgi:hypothetical protein
MDTGNRSIKGRLPKIAIMPAAFSGLWVSAKNICLSLKGRINPLVAAKARIT